MTNDFIFGKNIKISGSLRFSSGKLEGRASSSHKRDSISEKITLDHPSFTQNDIEESSEESSIVNTNVKYL